MDIKVEIYLNRMVVSVDGQTRSFTSQFSSVRLLVGDFSAAESCLRNALKEMKAFSVLGFRKPKLLIYPRERTEGGLSEIETRILVEIGRGAGAKEIEVIVDG